MMTDMNDGGSDLGALEHARESLYGMNAPAPRRAPARSAPEGRALPHAWEEEKLQMPKRYPKRVRVAGAFFGAAAAFFVVALAVAGYFFYFGGNTVSTDKVSIVLQGPTTIAGGDTVPLSLAIANKNPTALLDATIEIDFPEGTMSASDVSRAYPRYVENLGTIASGAAVGRSVKAIVFGGAGQTLTLPITFSYKTSSSNAVFAKKLSYALSVSSTPLSVSVEAPAETVSGAPITFTLLARSNATQPLDNVVLSPSTPFGFSVSSSSMPLGPSGVFIGTLAPGESKRVVITGALTGQDAEQRAFHFTIGTAKSSQDQSIAVAYMTQDATVTIAAPFIQTKLTLNGNDSQPIALAPGSTQSASLSYTNTLSTSVANASVVVSISGSAIDYGTVRATSGFYDSSSHSIVFSKDTDPSLAMLAPGASGIGTFTFSTLPPGGASPTVTFSISASGTRAGQAGVPEQVTTSAAVAAKVMTTVSLQAYSSRVSGPVPPASGKTTTYAVIWSAQNDGSAVAGGSVTATLPSYVTYTGETSGQGSFSYDSAARTVTWSVGNMPQGGVAEGRFQVALVPSTSQEGSIVPLTSKAAFSGYDRFAGVQVSTSADPATTETPKDAGYAPADAVVK